jgi:hypothetical protein
VTYRDEASDADVSLPLTPTEFSILLHMAR